MSENTQKLSLSLSAAKTKWREFLASPDGRTWFVSNFDMPKPLDRGVSTHSPKEFARNYRSAAMHAAAHPEMEWRDALIDYLMEHTDMTEWFVQNFFVYTLPQSVNSLSLKGAGIHVDLDIEGMNDPRLLDLNSTIRKQALLSVLRDSETIIGDERLIEWVIGVSRSQILDRFASDDDLIALPLFIKEPGSSLFDSWVSQEQLTDNMDDVGFATLTRMLSLLNVSPKDYVDRALIRKHDMLTDRFIDRLKDTPFAPVHHRSQLTDRDMVRLVDECHGGVPVVFGYAFASDLIKVDPRKPVRLEGLNIMFGVHDQINGRSTMQLIRQSQIEFREGIINEIDFDDKELPYAIQSFFGGFDQRSHSFAMRNIDPVPTLSGHAGAVDDGLDEPQCRARLNAAQAHVANF